MQFLEPSFKFQLDCGFSAHMTRLGLEITAVSQTNLGGSIPAWVQSQGRRLAKSKFLGSILFVTSTLSYTIQGAWFQCLFLHPIPLGWVCRDVVLH